MFEFTGSVPAGVNTGTVEVSRSPTLGQDGTLADDLNEGLGFVNRRDSDPSSWTGSALIVGLNNLGTFYYQYQWSAYMTPNACGAGPDGFGTCLLASPVYSFTVVPAQSPASAPQRNKALPLSLAQARRAALREVREGFGARRPKVVRVRRLSASRVLCRVTWRSKSGRKHTRTLKVRRTNWLGVEIYGGV